MTYTAQKRPPYYLTTELYPVGEVAEVTGFAACYDLESFRGLEIGELDVVCAINSGTLVTTVSYTAFTAYDTEMLKVVSASIDSGTLVTVVAYQAFTAYDPEELDVVCAIDSGTLVTVVAYVETMAYDPEELDVICTIEGGSLVSI